MKNNIARYTIILIVISVISCEKKQNTDKIDSLKNVINNNLGQKLKIPDSLETYYPFPSYNKKLMTNSKLKIYSHIDASCGTCIESLKAWNNLIPKLSKKNVQVNLICSSDNKFELLKYFFESKEINEFSHYLFLDYNNQYVRINKFMYESKNFETVLVNNDDEILLMGNPIFSEDMKEMYYNEIERSLK